MKQWLLVKSSQKGNGCREVEIIERADFNERYDTVLAEADHKKHLLRHPLAPQTRRPKRPPDV